MALSVFAVQLSEEELETMKEQLSIWKKLRHDLERVRMLAELSRRREKQKKELVSGLHGQAHTEVDCVHIYAHTYVRRWISPLLVERSWLKRLQT